MQNTPPTFIGRIQTYVKAHKAISAFMAMVILVIGYYGYKKAFAVTTPTQYVLGTVERGTLVSSITGTGQIGGKNQVDIKPKVSGEITSVAVAQGQAVKTGAIIARIDSRNATQAVSDARASLTSAQIALQKTQVSTTQTQEKAKDNLDSAYANGYSTVSGIFTDMPSIIDRSDTILNNWRHSPYMSDEQVRSSLGNNGVTTKNTIIEHFTKAKNAYQAAYDAYKSVSSKSDPAQVESILDTSYAMSKQVGDSLKEVRNFVGTLESAESNVSSELTADKTTLDQDMGTANSDIGKILTAQTNIKNAKNDLAAATETYQNISQSKEPLDVQTARLTVTQKQNAYQEALNTLSDYTIRAPFDGIIASLDVKKGDNATTGTTLATIITQQKVATISLNELDIAKVKVGQKATLTFDAIPNTTFTGSVASVDILGTASQGVVSYGVDITLDTDDERIKPGMSVSASIITDTKSDVLMVPTSAVKSDNQGSYVEILSGPTSSTTQGVTSSVPPRQQGVEVGSSNETASEIISGLNEGDKIIVRTITPTKTTTTNAPSLFGGGNTRGAAGGNVRTGTGPAR
jgi:HlyD family secretion protein